MPMYLYETIPSSPSELRRGMTASPKPDAAPRDWCAGAAGVVGRADDADARHGRGADAEWRHGVRRGLRLRALSARTAIRRR